MLNNENSKELVDKLNENEGNRMPTVLVTGANRGIGLEFVRQYAADGWMVFATCRKSESAHDLKDIPGNVRIFSMDITDENQIMTVANELRSETIDVLINNAAIPGPRESVATFGKINITAWIEVMRVNTMSPLKVVEYFINNVKVSKKKMIVFISSRAGSIAERGQLVRHRQGGSYIFRTSKTALNSVARSLAFDLGSENIGVLVLHPGWVRTENGGPDADVDPKTSVAGMRCIIEQFKPNGEAIFRTYDDQVIPW